MEYLDLMNPLADALLADIQEATGLDVPAIAISDFLENAYLPELYAVQKLLEKRGLQLKSSTSGIWIMMVRSCSARKRAPVLMRYTAGQ